MTPIQRQSPSLFRWKGPDQSNIFIRFLSLLSGLVKLAVKRLRHHPGLSLLALLGIMLAIGLVTSASFFAQAVDTVILRRELAEYSRLTKRPPFATRIYTYSSPENPLSLARSEQLGQDVANTLSAEVGLPLSRVALLFDSGVMTLLPEPGSDKYVGQRSLGKPHALFIDGVQDHIRIMAGEAMDDGTSGGDSLEVWMHTFLAEKIGVQPGENFELEVGGSSADILIPITVRGVWQAADPADPFWFDDPDQTLRENLLVRHDDFLIKVEPHLSTRGRTASWQIVLDESAVIPAKVRDYVSGFARGEAIVNRYVPDARLTAPSVSLEKFVQRQTTLTTLLLGFNIPAFGFLLYFLILTSAVIAYWQRRETAVFVSRGMSVSSVLNFTFIEELILFVIGLPLGLGFGILIARFMGDTSSFLIFSEREPLPVSLLGINIPLTLFTLVVVLVARLLPAAQAARQTILDQEREHTRPQKGPFWYRNYLDLLLVVPTVYAYNQLVNRGTLAVLVRDRPEDLFRDPLLILVPAFFIVTASLLVMRLFPLIMRIIDKLAVLIPGVGPYLALRQLGRQGHSYINPLLLVIVSLALGIYTLSMAASLDQWLIDRMYYRAGADLTFEPFLESQVSSETAGGSIGADWIPPHDEFAALPNVTDAARVGDYPLEISLVTGSSRTVRGRFLAVDRIDFPKVAWFRDDFASESLGSLMNRLATVPNSVLVSRQFLEENQLRIGDQLEMNVVVDFGAAVDSTFAIAGTYEYFPTVYEDEELTVIGNLEYLFSFYGLTMPHNIWLRTQNGADGAIILEEVETTGIETIKTQDTRASIDSEQAKMERVGVFGTLSVSFLAAAVMAALGLLTYSYASLQERLYHFALLHAVGLKRVQIIGQVFLEYFILTVYGAAAGIFIGSAAATYFVPLFRITGESGIPLPPLIPIIAQNEIVPLVVIFVSSMILLELLIIAVALYRGLFGILRMGYQG